MTHTSEVMMNIYCISYDKHNVYHLYFILPLLSLKQYIPMMYRVNIVFPIFNFKLLDCRYLKGVQEFSGATCLQTTYLHRRIRVN